MTNIFFIILFLTTIFGNDDRLRIIQADLMQSHQIEYQPVMELTGNVILQKNNLFLFTEKATNYTKINIFELSGRVTMIEDEDTLKCKNLTYFSDSLDYILAIGNVNYRKPNELIRCDSLYFWTDIDSGIAIGNVNLESESQNVSTDYIHYKETKGPRGISFSAYRNVNIIEGNRIIQTDTLLYNDEIELMSLKNGGVVKEPKKGIIGDAIFLQYKDSILQNIDIAGNAEAWQDFDSKIKENDPRFYQFRNEMKSKFITVDLENDEIKKMHLKNMAETIYHVSEDSLLMGTNTASGDTIILTFQDSELNRIQVIGGSQGIFKPEVGNTKIDTTITYKANYLDYFVDKKQTQLIENAIVEYQETKLEAGNIVVDWKENILNAIEYNDILPTVYTGGTEPLIGDDMTFDLISKHGKINKGKTEYNSGFYHGEKIYRDEPDIFHVKDSKYTSCELDNPHYYFASNKMKLVGDDRVIAKPLILHIFDIPIIGIPFAVFPNKGGSRHSGWIMPAFGTRTSTGTFFQRLGYYYAPNEYVDLKTLFDFYDKLGVVINSKFNYIKRYNYNGSLSTRINQSLVGKDVVDLFDNFTRQFNIIWHHSQKLDPTQNLSINAQYVSNSNFYQSNWNDKSNQLTQKIESHLNYSKRWSAWKNNFSMNISDSYDLLSDIRKLEGDYSHNHFLVERSQSLPNLSFSHSKGKIKIAGKEYPILKDIYWDYSSNLTNSIRKGWKYNSIENDSLFNPFWEDSTNIRTGIKHNMSFSTSNKFFGWLSLSPRISFKENWVNQYTKLNQQFETEYISGFKRRLTWNTSLSMSTKLYGLFPISVGKLDAIRHVMTPSISFNWSPNFSEHGSPFIQSFVDTALTHDYFYGTLAGATPSVESKSIGLGLSNIFQAKVKNEGEYKKIDLISWSLNSNYNFTADSLKLAPVNSSISSTLPNGLRLSLTMSHDFYGLNSNGQRINQFKKYPRLKSVNGGTSLKFSGKRFIFSNSTEIDTASQLIEDESSPLLGAGNNFSSSNQNLWNSTFSIRYSYTPRENQDALINFWVNTNLDIQLTPAWKMNYNARIDLEKLELVSHDFTFKRNLHCFEFLFEWTPTGYRQGFYLRINVINRDLKESIKLESRGGNSFWQ